MRASIVKSCVVACAALAAFGARSFADEPKTEQIRWSKDLYAAHNVSVETGKPMLILIASESCPPCRKLKTATFSDPRIVKYINASFIPVQLDFEKDAKAIEILEVEQIPTTIVLSPNADLLGRLVGFATAQDYHAALEKTRVVHRRIESLRQASASKENVEKK